MATSVRARPNRRSNDEEAAQGDESESLVPASLKFHMSENQAAATASFENASSVSWNDSFYKNDTSVIAVFDVDYKKMITVGTTKARVVMLWFTGCVVLAVILSLTEDAWLVNILWIPAFILLRNVDLHRRFVFQIQRRHVAISRRGVYIDDADEPGSSRLIRRQVIPLDSIEGCSVCLASGSPPVYEAVLNVKLDHGLYATVKDTPVPGLIEAQLFTDLLLSVKQSHKKTAVPGGSDDAVA